LPKPTQQGLDPLQAIQLQEASLERDMVLALRLGKPDQGPWLASDRVAPLAAPVANRLEGVGTAREVFGAQGKSVDGDTFRACVALPSQLVQVAQQWLCAASQWAIRIAIYFAIATKRAAMAQQDWDQLPWLLSDCIAPLAAAANWLEDVGAGLEPFGACGKHVACGCGTFWPLAVGQLSVEPWQQLVAAKNEVGQRLVKWKWVVLTAQLAWPLYLHFAT
jgi:hypothetical protein